MTDEELVRDIAVLVDTLKQMTTASDKSMNVAYADETALRPLKTILINIAQNFQGFMSKETIKQQQEVAKVTEQLKKTEESIKRTAEKQEASDNNALKALDSLEKEAQKSNSSLALLTRIGQSLTKIVTDSVKQMSENSMKFARFAQDLSGAGVAIQDGGKGFRESLTDSANKIGLKTDEFVKMVSGNSQALARLSASGVNQMNYMTDAMAQYQTIAGASKEDASAVWSYMADTILKFDTDEQLRNRNMATESRILLENFRDLSFATGKSVENLTKEMDARKKNYMEAMFQKNRPELYNKIAATAMPEVVKEYALTGRQTPELMRLIGLNPEVGQLMAVFDRMRSDRNYDNISMEDYGKMVNPIIDRIQANAQGFASMGPYFANAYNETLMQGLEFGKIGAVPAKPESSEQLGFLDALKEMRVSLNKLDNEKILTYSISLNKFELATKAIAGTADYAAEALRNFHNSLGDLASVVSNFTSSAANVAGGLIANAATSGVSSYFGAKLGARGVAQGASKSGLMKTGLKLGTRALTYAGPALAYLGAFGGGGYLGYKIATSETGRKASDWVGDKMYALSKWWNSDELTEQQEKLRRAKEMLSKKATEQNDSTPPELDFSGDKLSDVPKQEASAPAQPKTEEYLGSILGLLEQLTKEIESDAFYRKANQKQANNMTE